MKFSFRLHFKHGEHIDFYADAEEKYSEWMRVLMKVLADRPAEEAQWIGEVEEARSSLGSNSGKTDGSSSKARRPGVAEIQWNDPAASHAATDNKHWESASADSMDDEERQLAAAMDAPMGKKLAGAVKLPVLTMKPPTLPPRAKMAGPSGIDALADRFATVTTITMNEPFVCNPIEEEQEEEGQDQSERRISAAVSDVERRRSVGLFGSMKSSQNRYRRSIV